MSIISEIITHPDKGLLPYVDSKMGDNFINMQMRPWNFNGSSPGVGAGIRIPDFKPDFSGNFGLQQRTVYLGKFLEITSPTLEVVIQGAEYSDYLCQVLHEAPRCVVHIQDINTSPGTTYPKQSKSNQKWYLIVFTEFQIKYLL